MRSGEGEEEVEGLVLLRDVLQVAESLVDEEILRPYAVFGVRIATVLNGSILILAVVLLILCGETISLGTSEHTDCLY